ncbi:sensor histidine kinase [Micromonosporaceae bacterium Da 78-11]
MSASADGLSLLRRLTWWGLFCCLIAVAFLVVTEAATLPRGARTLAVVATAVALTIAAVLFARPVPRVVVVAAALAAAVVVALARAADTGAWPWVLPLACVAAAAWATWPRPVVPGAAAGLAFVAALTGSQGLPGPALVDAAVTVLATIGLCAQIWILRIAERLDAARTFERAAAVAEERLRFAADLHDIQGHSLQVIALKSELAERLTQIDPARATAEMREVQALARRALGDTRDVVNGYRAVSLPTEITNAARVLRAAGIEVSVVVPPKLPEPAAALFGLVVRECTTNVLRHSTASRCEIEVAARDGLADLRFTNDGPLGVAPGPAGGLAGLADRLTAAGGELDYRGTPQSFTVRATVPAAS